jgi:hypothetical protein
LTTDQVAPILAVPTAWWNGDEGVDIVMWTYHSDLGERIYSSAHVDELYSWRRDEPYGRLSGAVQ